MPGGPACTGCRTRGTSSASDRSRRRECLPARPPGDALGQVGHVTRGGALSRHSGHVARELNGGIFICVGTHPVRVPIARHEHRLIPLDQQPERDAGRSRAPREGTGAGRLVHGLWVPPSWRCSRKARLLGDTARPGSARVDRRQPCHRQTPVLGYAGTRRRVGDRRSRSVSRRTRSFVSISLRHGVGCLVVSCAGRGDGARVTGAPVHECANDIEQ